MYLVCGSRGNIGAELVRALAGAGEPVRALTRSGGLPDAPDGVEVVHGDLDRPETLSKALVGVSGMFLLPGYQDMPGVLAEVRRAGAERVVLLSGSSAAGGDESNAVSAYMIRSERAVRESGLPATFLRPFGFMSNTLRWLPELQAGDVVSEPFADVAIGVIDPYDIAAVAAAALRSDAHEGQAYLLSGPDVLLPGERLAMLGAALGRDLRLEALSRDEARRRMSGQMPPEYVEAMFSFYADGTLDESRVVLTIEQVLGRPPRPFSAWVSAHADEFR